MSARSPPIDEETKPLRELELRSRDVRDESWHSCDGKVPWIFLWVKMIFCTLAPEASHVIPCQVVQGSPLVAQFPHKAELAGHLCQNENRAEGEGTYTYTRSEMHATTPERFGSPPPFPPSRPHFVHAHAHQAEEMACIAAKSEAPRAARASEGIRASEAMVAARRAPSPRAERPTSQTAAQERARGKGRGPLEREARAAEAASSEPACVAARAAARRLAAPPSGDSRASQPNSGEGDGKKGHGTR